MTPSQDAEEGRSEADEGEGKVPRVIMRLEALQFHDPTGAETQRRRHDQPAHDSQSPTEIIVVNDEWG